MANMRATMIINHEYTGVTLNDFPENKRAEIAAILRERGYDENGDLLQK